MWATAHGQMLLGNDLLSVRYLITLGIGYLTYLLVLRLWAAALLRRDSTTLDGNGDLGLPDVNVSGNADAPAFASGGGGDFGGGGASGSFADASSSGEGIASLASEALGAAAGAEEGSIVVVPVVAIFLVGLAVVFGAGSLALAYFGWDVLLVVAVELAFQWHLPAPLFGLRVKVGCQQRCA